MSVWNPENVKDIAESIGIPALHEDAIRALTADIEFRLSQVLEEAMQFMRHGKRTCLTTQDISHALRILDVEPLYGYESTRPLRFGEATIGPGQPLYYVDDQEVDFEKLINAPLPKVPREISFTAHWLAVEGVQPSIPQNPSTAESRSQELAPKGPNNNLAAMSNADNVVVKPLVKHVLSKELQQYFEKVCTALVDENNADFRSAALASIGEDPGLHQLLPYFVQFIAEKVTHCMKSIFILSQMMHLTHALLTNKGLFIDPYIASLVAPIITCLVGRNLGPPNDPPSSYPLRQMAASLLGFIAKHYGSSSQTLKPRMARTCLKYFLDPTKSIAAQYGGMLGLQAIGGPEMVQALVIPSLKDFESIIIDAIGSGDEIKRAEAEHLSLSLVDALAALEKEVTALLNPAIDRQSPEMLRTNLEGKVGQYFAQKILGRDSDRLAKIVLDS